MKAECRDTAPNQGDAYYAYYRALQHDVIPGSRGAGTGVVREPVIHRAGDPAAKLPAYRVDDNGVPHPGRRSADPESVCVVESPEQ